MPFHFESPLLHCYWISLAWPAWEGPGFVVGLDQPIGLGVTAFTIEDATQLLAEHGQDRYLSEAQKVEWIEITDLEQLKEKWLQNHVLPNAGPLYFRGVWMGGLNVGIGASGQRSTTIDEQP